MLIVLLLQKIFSWSRAPRPLNTNNSVKLYGCWFFKLILQNFKYIGCLLCYVTKKNTEKSEVTISQSKFAKRCVSISRQGHILFSLCALPFEMVSISKSLVL